MRVYVVLFSNFLINVPRKKKTPNFSMSFALFDFIFIWHNGIFYTINVSMHSNDPTRLGLFGLLFWFRSIYKLNKINCLYEWRERADNSTSHLFRIVDSCSATTCHFCDQNKSLQTVGTQTLIILTRQYRYWIFLENSWLLKYSNNFFYWVWTWCQFSN